MTDETEYVDDELSHEEQMKAAMALRRSEIQGLLKKMALAFGDDTGKGLLHLYEAISLLKSEVGIQPLKEAWGDTYYDKDRRLKVLGLKVANLRFFFSQLNDQKVRGEADPTSENFIRYRRMFSDVVQESDLLYDAFHTLLTSTKTAKHLSIPNEYWSKARREDDER